MPAVSAATDLATGPVIDRPAFRTGTSLRLEQLGAGLAGLVITLGVAVLAGYAIRNEQIVQLARSLPPMYPNAALGLICGGVGVVASRRHGPWRALAMVATVLLAAIGVVGLWLNIAESDRTWFEGLFPIDFVAPTTPVGGRPVAETCVAFILLAGGLASLTSRRHAVLGQAFGVAGASVGFSAVLGYVLGVDRTSLGANLVYVGMALHTALGIGIVGLAIVLVRPNVGFLAQLLDGGAAGSVTRRVTLSVVLAPLALIVLGVVLSGLLPSEKLSQSVFSVLQVAVLSGAVLIPAAIIGRTDQELRTRLDAARRYDEGRIDVNTVTAAITRELAVEIPDIVGWEVGMRHEPATGHVAGDSIHVLRRERPHPATLVAVLDIAGHDALSAVVAYALRAHVAALWNHGATLADLASSLNDELIRRDTIATGVLLSLPDGSDEIELVNAGHPEPVHLHAGEVTTWPRTRPLFGVPTVENEPRPINVRDGDLMVLYTDGLTEARSAAGDELGDDSVSRIVAARQLEPVRAIADACIDRALEHTQSRLLDDVLIVVARRTS